MFLTAFFVFWAVVAWKVYFYVAYRRRDLAGKVALITGGGSGIGRKMAHILAAKGCQVVLWDVNAAGMDKVKGELAAAGAACSTYVVDVSDRELVYRVAKEVGDVDILINNAGIVSGRPFMDTPDELIVKTMQVNTMAHFWTLKAFLPAMLRRNDGHVVTIASAAGTAGVAGLVDYCASKFGAVGVGESLYMELRKRKSQVRTTLVCPYYINTGMFDGVRTRFPLLLPILSEDYASSRIILAVERGEEYLCMPWIVGVAFMFKVLPVPWQATVAELLGLSDGMDTFKHRTASASTAAKKSA